MIRYVRKEGQLKLRQNKYHMHWSTVSAAEASSRDLTAAKKAAFLWVTTCWKKGYKNLE
jgi:hypothetical protein